MSENNNHAGRDVVAIVLSLAIAVALILITFGVGFEAIFHGDTDGLSDNATQLLLTVLGGVIGVLGSYIGARGVRDAASAEHDRLTNDVGVDDPVDGAEVDAQMDGDVADVSPVTDDAAVPDDIGDDGDVGKRRLPGNG